MTPPTGRILRDDEHPRWDAWIEASEGANVRQLSAYRGALALYGHTSEILATEEGGEWTGGALLGLRSPGFGLGGWAQASGGLVLGKPDEPAALRALAQAAIERCRRRGASSLEVSLRQPRRIGDRKGPHAAALEAELRALGFRESTPWSTYYVDLSVPSEDALLEGFGKNPRRHIRKALREGLEVEPSTATEEVDAFERAHAAMTGRKGLSSLPRGFGPKVLLPLIRSGGAVLFVARFRGVPRNYLVAGAVGIPIYHWGALVEAARDPDCPQTGQALHFAAMCYFRRLGKPYYDFGGTPGPVPEPAHPNYTVWKFKHEFGGLYASFPGSFRVILRPVHAALLAVARRGLEARRRRTAIGQ